MSGIHYENASLLNENHECREEHNNSDFFHIRTINIDYKCNDNLLGKDEKSCTGTQTMYVN